jgi:hypothetical protein
MNTSKSKMTWIVAVVLILAAFLFYGGYTTFVKRPSLDAHAIAKAEAAMWKAYYTDDEASLAWNLVTLFRSQFGLTWWEAGTISKNFAESAMKFRKGKADHETAIIPGLIEAYALIQHSSESSFDPAKAARAELAWWVARRTPGRDSPKYVGKQIEYLYEVLYGTKHPAFEKAGFLRAQAAEFRDQGGKDADWQKIEALLIESYQELIRAVQENKKSELVYCRLTADIVSSLAMGISIQNAEPVPNLLSTPISPFMRCTNSLLIANPRPVPPYNLV